MSDAIARPKISQKLADAITRKIYSGEVSAGDYLPLEADLAEQYRVGRVSVREALRILEAQGLISITQGSKTGAIINAIKIDNITDLSTMVLRSRLTTLSEIYAARNDLELMAVYRMAREPKGSDVTALLDFANRMLRDVQLGEYKRCMATGRELHRFITSSVSNSALIFIEELLFSFVSRHQVKQLAKRDGASFDPEKIRWGVDSVGRLAKLIAEGDTERVLAHWRLHLETATKVWLPPDDMDRTIDVVEI